jgi:hypothetical protein
MRSFGSGDPDQAGRSRERRIVLAMIINKASNGGDGSDGFDPLPARLDRELWGSRAPNVSPVQATHREK